MTEFIIPDAHWSEELSKVVKHVEPGDVIVVSNRNRYELANAAMERQGVSGVRVLIQGEDPGDG